MPNENTCGHCAHWAPMDKRRFLGVCGHPKKPNECTDRVSSCEDFEPGAGTKDPEFLE